MPTPVDIARQFLAEAAADVLDDAVAVAKQRSHAQTTSLHIISALLALPSSTLRETCTRSRGSAYSPRLQFRALELCVDVALDRVSVSKSAGNEPPVSNSLMAAIKRSQANQRRHPETFHLYQQQLSSNSQTCPSISTVKVELKYFVISILDDPIVSRVLGDAGFRTHEIKMAILNPLSMSRFSSTNYRPTPLFSCSLGDFELNKPTNSFPFSKATTTEKNDENARRIAEIILRSSRRNPLLVGAYASDASKMFINCLKRGEKGVVPKEIDGLIVVSVEHEISEGLNGEMIRLKFKQVDEMVKDCQGPGIMINSGDLKVFVDVELVNVVNYMVLELKRLLITHSRKLWWIGFMASDGDYKKLVERFPSIEIDWGLQLLPITTAPTRDKCFESSLLRSFVPLGGFFSMPPENESLCNLCNEKYEREVSHVLKGISTKSVSDKESITLFSWMQCQTSKRSLAVIAEAKEENTVSDGRVVTLKRKWSDICRKLHSSLKDTTSSVVSLSNARKVTNFLSPCNLQKSSMPKQDIPTPISLCGHVNAEAKIPVQGLELNMSLPATFFPVTTNLRLGTLHDSDEGWTRIPEVREYNMPIQRSELSRSNEISPGQVSQSSSSRSHHLEKKSPWTVLAEKIYWQMEAIQTISQTVLLCRNGNGNRNGSLWLGFTGPDRVGKRKVASGVAEIVFGTEENFLSWDLKSQDAISSVVDFCDSKCRKLNSGRKMIVDYFAEELSKHRHSVVLLENVDKADFLVRDSLLRAIKTGKFPDSHGREININNNVFVLASTAQKATEHLFFGEVASEFPEDKILEAKNLQMRILVGSSDRNSRRSNNTTRNVTVMPSTLIYNHCTFNKRTLSSTDLTRAEMSKRACPLSRSTIDLNLPVEDMEDRENDKSDSEDSEVWLKQLFEHVDGNVVFKPFDFDSLSLKILMEIDGRLKKLAGATVWLEIDQQVMLQILAAVWLTDGEKALEDWIEQVLCLSIEEAHQRCNFTCDVVMKLVPCDGLVVDVQAAGLRLPARIGLN
ncbi:hypothetical protein OROGR_019748 [Orobanche gracilis]